MSASEAQASGSSEQAGSQQQPPQGDKAQSQAQAQQKKDKKKDKKDKAAGASADSDAQRPLPDFIRFREDIFDELYAKQQEELKAKEPVPIVVTLPDGKEIKAEAWRTTPYDIAKGISEGLAQAAVIAKVNGALYDMERVLEGNCTLEFLKFDNPEGKDTFWHSSAHILGLAMEEYYGGSLCYGPPIDNGFFYDMEMPGRVATEQDFDKLENIANRAIKAKLPFQRLVVKKEDLLRLFKDNRFKQRLITERIQEEATTVYRCGPLIDLCHGPHIRNTSVVKAFWVNKCSSTYWEGKVEAEQLQRVYAISFPDKKQLTEYKHLLEEAAKRDHRKIGVEQDLFFFHQLSPGSCFFLPRGAHIYKVLQDMIREQYLKRGFQEVITPNIFNKDLWETSGHWQHYAENMFSFEVEKETFALKPMNCPSHCLMFASRARSYRELPIRFADFGVLHRNELSGALTGLTRVRRFQQDDAHIFCETSQIENEIRGCLDFLQEVYGIFGFTFELNLSTRPEKFLGEVEVWDRAEKALASALDGFGHPWKLNPGDGAFYGPKIDIKVNDALKRMHQCATIQLDFQLPQRFKLEYQSSEGSSRPVIIHRAVLGSTERMFAILCEHYGGKWPFWLSPRQCIVIPIAPKFNSYAEEVQRTLHMKGFMVDCDVSDSALLNKKIRNACSAHYNFVLVVGGSEEKRRSVNVRTRDNAQHGEHLLDSFVNHLETLRRDKRIEGDHLGMGTPLPKEKEDGEAVAATEHASEGASPAPKGGETTTV